MSSEGEKERDAEPKERYEPPAILWEELFEPVALTMSCTHQQINPGCSPGPFGT